MRLYRQIGPGIGHIVLRTETTPVPAADEVLIKVHAVSLNYRDLLLAQGIAIKGEIHPAFIPCSDGAGEVVAIGDRVTRFRAGDRVAPIFTPGWIYGGSPDTRGGGSLGGELDGMLTEYRALSEQGDVAIPPHLSYAEGACLPCAGVTAWHAVRNVRSEDTVLLLGTGGVSIMALQILKAMGARVIITSSSDEKLQRCRDLGADECVNYCSSPEWDREVRRLTGGRGVDHVVEVGGGGTLARSIEATAPDGHIHVIGVLTQGSVDPTRILLRGLHVHGIRVGSRELFEQYVRFLSRHNIRPAIDRIYSFDEAPEAFVCLKKGRHVGKFVVQVLASP